VDSKSPDIVAPLALAAARFDRCLIEQFGGVEQLRVVSSEQLPVPAVGQVRVRVEAASVQYTDTVIRRGKYPDAGRLPITLGYDLVGRVDALGPKSDGWRVGDRVADLTKVGAHASHALVAADGLVRVPEQLEAAQATALILSGVTAHQMMFRHVQVRAGQRLLIQGGHGGVGWFAIQLACQAGAKVWTTARAEHHEQLRRLGATPLDYRDATYPEALRRATSGGVDIVFDGQGQEHFRPSLRSLRSSGRLVAIGASDAVNRGGGMTFSVVSALLRNLLPFGPRISFYSITRMRKARPDWFRADLAALLDKLARGDLTVRIARCIGFDQLAEAHSELERGGVDGKIVLLPAAVAAAAGAAECCSRA
jgi:NADPH:quinone reductase-like Zn-dependent oxidoreductase